MARSWRRIKHDFLSHFGNPRLDLIVWVLVRKLQPLYVRHHAKDSVPNRPPSRRSIMAERVETRVEDTLYM
jgi:hypothetical protein